MDLTRILTTLYIAAKFSGFYQCLISVATQKFTQSWKKAKGPFVKISIPAEGMRRIELFEVVSVRVQVTCLHKGDKHVKPSVIFLYRKSISRNTTNPQS